MRTNRQMLMAQIALGMPIAMYTAEDARRSMQRVSEDMGEFQKALQENDLDKCLGILKGTHPCVEDYSSSRHQYVANELNPKVIRSTDQLPKSRGRRIREAKARKTK